MIRLKESVNLYQLNKKIAISLKELDTVYNNKSLSIKNFKTLKGMVLH